MAFELEEDLTPIKVWEISPHHSKDYDSYWTKGETEEDHQRALHYALERVEQAWDEMELDEEVTVTIKLIEVPTYEYEAVTEEG